MNGLFAIGDVHGDVRRAEELLQAARLIDAENRWRGESSNLIFIGDLTDRGVHGLKVIALVRSLQEQAEQAGGYVESLMGNHDAVLLARAFECRGEKANPDCWPLFIANGGKDREAKAIADDDETFRWLQARPMMVAIGDTLFQHADSAAYYRRLGSTIEEVNVVGARLAETAQGAWRIFYEMTDGRGWDTGGLRAPRTAELNLEKHLAQFEARRVVHGHSRHLEWTPVVYAKGRAINIDGSLSEGYRKDSRRGFIADLDAIGYSSA